jgi:hypothetical protein
MTRRQATTGAHPAIELARIRARRQEAGIG